MGVGPTTLMEKDLGRQLEDYMSGRTKPSQTNGLRDRLSDTLRTYLKAAESTTRDFCVDKPCETEREHDFIMVERARLKEMLLIRSVIDQIDAVRSRTVSASADR